MSLPPRTHLTFHHDAKLHKQQSTLTSLQPFSSLSDSDKLLFKTFTGALDTDLVAICPETIFHPQGGGQPSDVGDITSTSNPSAKLQILAARTDSQGQVLHLGRHAPDTTPPAVGDAVTQEIDAEKRLLFSRLHTAGHVLGAAVRHLLEDKVEGFDELKASHFPDSAACEFAGLIEGKWKDAIQTRLDEYVAKAMPVEIEFWDEGDFRKAGLERLIPDREVMGMAEGEKFRVVNIVGAEVYPCGGTHVETTDKCGKTVVRKIARSKGTSRVGYTVV